MMALSICRSASWLASANYLGYFLGAAAVYLPALDLGARFFFSAALDVCSSLVRAGLVATGFLTLAMALAVSVCLAACCALPPA